MTAETLMDASVQPLLSRFTQPFRFLAAGALNTALGFAFYPALLWVLPFFRAHYLTALAVSQVVCLCIAFCTYKAVVFRSRGNILAEFGKFASFYGFNYAANWAALPLLVKAAKLPPVVAQTGFTALLVVSSYFWHRYVTFKSARDPS